MAKKLQIVLGTWGIRSSFRSLLALLLTILIITTVYLSQDSSVRLFDQNRTKGVVSQCNLFSGEWVFDNQSYPLYKEQQCTFMSDQLACEKFGRKDLSYQNWRWQPHQCNLPRYIYVLFFLFLFPDVIVQKFSNTFLFSR
jgi:hypothetical protein